MFVLICGGGRTGTQLAHSLLAENHEVRIIEHRPEIIRRLHQEIPTEIIIQGSSTDPATLKQAGIQRANVVAACTTSDADNLVICFLAREMFKINRTIARINNPRDAWLFTKDFKVDVGLNQADIMTSLIEEEMSLGDMMTLLKLRRGQYSLIEEKIPANAKAVGMAIKDLALPEQCVIAAIIRQGKVVMPRGMTTLEMGDEVLAVTDPDGASQLAKLFRPDNGGATPK